jgi:NAD-dependent dihydropyrimidine dehydrogenase PreA subunit
MAYEITKNCSGNDTACIDICPVGCIFQAKHAAPSAKRPRLYIDAEQCIDCGACARVCPESAIALATEAAWYARSPRPQLAERLMFPPPTDPLFQKTDFAAARHV